VLHNSQSAFCFLPYSHTTAAPNKLPTTAADEHKPKLHIMYSTNWQKFNKFFDYKLRTIEAENP